MISYNLDSIADMRAAGIRTAQTHAKDSRPETIRACKRTIAISIYWQDRCRFESSDWHWHDAFIAELGEWLMLHNA